jgi:hypothetical protein
VADLPPACQVYPFEPDLSFTGCVNERTGAAVTVVVGIDLDVVLGRKAGIPYGLPKEEHPR